MSSKPSAPSIAIPASAVHDPVLAPPLKGWPHDGPALAASRVGDQGWNLLAGDLPLPVAVLKREALAHNIAWMAERTRAWGVELVPHGKTTMSPQLFRRQLEAGAWGITFATVMQVAVGVAAGVRRALIANEVMDASDLAHLAALRRRHADLRVIFLVDSKAQLALIEAWQARQEEAVPPFEVLLEIGFGGGRTGVRSEAEALALAQALHASPAVRFAGIECYEGLWAKGESGADRAWVDTLMDRVDAVAAECVRAGLFEGEEFIVSAGGSAVFDLVAARLRPALGRPVRGLLRSGCYVTHDHGTYTRMMEAMAPRLGCPTGCDVADMLRPALEVWALVQSCPEPGLAIVGAGKRDLSFDMGMPVPIARAAAGQSSAQPVPAGWRIDALNDQHAYLRWEAGDAALAAQAPVVGERIGLGISHPCTTFDKWHWMPVVDEAYRVCDAVTMQF